MGAPDIIKINPVCNNQASREPMDSVSMCLKAIKQNNLHPTTNKTNPNTNLLSISHLPLLSSFLVHATQFQLHYHDNTLQNKKVSRRSTSGGISPSISFTSNCPRFIRLCLAVALHGGSSEGGVRVQSALGPRSVRVSFS